MVDLNMTLIAQIINFVILLLVLKKWAYKPLMQALADRQARIANSLETADKERLAAEELKREYQEQLAQARAQAQAIVEKATKLAEQTKDEIVQEARAEHARLMKETQEEIARGTGKRQLLNCVMKLFCCRSLPLPKLSAKMSTVQPMQSL